MTKKKALEKKREKAKKQLEKHYCSDDMKLIKNL